MKAHEKSQEISAQFEVPKNRGKLYKDVNIAMCKNWKNGENSRHFSKFKKRKILILGGCKI